MMMKKHRSISLILILAMSLQPYAGSMASFAAENDQNDSFYEAESVSDQTDPDAFGELVPEEPAWDAEPAGQDVLPVSDGVSDDETAGDAEAFFDEAELQDAEDSEFPEPIEEAFADDADLVSGDEWLIEDPEGMTEEEEESAGYLPDMEVEETDEFILDEGMVVHKDTSLYPGARRFASSSSGAETASFTCYGDQLDEQARKLYDFRKDYFVTQRKRGTLDNTTIPRKFKADPLTFNSSTTIFTFDVPLDENDKMDKTSDEYMTAYSNILHICQAAADAFQYDHPEMFWTRTASYSVGYTLTGQIMETQDGRRLRRCFVSKITYTAIEAYPYASDDIAAYDAAVAQTAAMLQSASDYDLDGTVTENELLQGIHDYICERCWYDRVSLGNYKTTGDYSIFSSAGVFIENENLDTGIVCEGYSRGFKVLCDRFGITCACVGGDVTTSTDMGHMWNTVCIGGIWYMVDVTWDDGTFYTHKLFLSPTDGKRTPKGYISGPVNSQNYSFGTVTYDSKCFALPALGSDTHEYIVENEAASACTGYIGYVCSHEDAIRYWERDKSVSEIPGHTVVTLPGQPSSCIEHGFSGDTLCSVCGMVFSLGEELDFADHIYENGECIVCGAKLTVENAAALIEALDVEAPSSEAYQKAADAYDQLSDEEKGQLPEEVLAHFLEAQANRAMLDAISAQILAVDEEIPDAAALAAAREAFEELTDKQEALLAAEETHLQTAETNLAKINSAASMIMALDAQVPSASDLAAAQEDFEGLTDQQKASMTEEETQLQTAAANLAKINSAASVIMALDPEVPSASDLGAAQEAYAALTDRQKALLTEETAYLQAVQAVRTMLDELSARVLAIDEEIPNASDLAAAQEDFEELTDQQKASMTEEETQLQAAAANLAKINSAASAIMALDPEVPSASDLAAAQEAYAALSDRQKAVLEEETAYLQAVQAVRTMLDELSARILAVDEEIPNASDLEAAQEAFDNLTDKQKSSMRAEETQLQTAAANLAKIGQTAELILALDSEAPAPSDYAAAQEAYAALTDRQKALLTEETAYLQAVQAVRTMLDGVSAQILAIDDEIPDPADLAAAQTAYEALTDKQKALLAAEGTQLQTAAANLAKIDHTAELVMALDSEAPPVPDFEEAQEAYEALTDRQKALLVAEGAYLQEVQAVRTMLDGIAAQILAIDGETPLASDIEAAQTAFDSLSAPQKALLENEEAHLQQAKGSRALMDIVETLILSVKAEAPDEALLKSAESALAKLSDKQKAALGEKTLSHLKEAEETKARMDREAARTDLSTAAVTVEHAVWTGKPQEPAVTVSLGEAVLKRGTDYTVSYANNENVGTAKVIVAGVGNYKGSTEQVFDILPAAPSNVKAAALTSGRKASIKWKYTGKASGFEIQAAGKKSFKKIAKKITLKASARKSVVKKLNSGKVWYFRIRSFYRTGGRTYYSSWSDVKRIKFKK